MRTFDERNAELCERSLYHLQCEDGKHYVGMTKTRNFDVRIDEQFGRPNPYNIPPAIFCQRHKPEKLISRIDLPQMQGEDAEIFEDAFTLACKLKYGKDNVAGGHECASPGAVVDLIKRMVSAGILSVDILKAIVEHEELINNTKIESN